MHFYFCTASSKKYGKMQYKTVNERVGPGKIIHNRWNGFRVANCLATSQWIIE